MSNPGSNGFPIDGQTYTYDVGVPDAEGGSQGPYVPGVDVSAGYVDSNGQPKDLSAPTKVTLAQYLSKVTLGQEGSTTVPNAYPIDPQANVTTLEGPDGLPTPLEPVANSTSTSFAGGNEATFDYPSMQYPVLAPLIKKGKASTGPTGGNDLLPGIPGTSTYVASPGNQAGDSSVNPQPIVGHPNTAGTVAPYVSAVLANNRFAAAGTNSQQPYVAADVDIANPPSTYNPSFAEQGKLGQHDPAAASVTAGQLAAIGSLLTMRAGLEAGVNNPGADPNSASTQAQALLPGMAQLGLSTVGVGQLYASDVLASLTTDEVPSSNVLSIGDQSWGQLNNVDDPFSGTDALGMLALSVALVAGMLLLFDALSIILGLITPSLKAPARDGQGRYALGEYFPGTKAGQKAAGGGIGGTLTALSTLNLGALLGLQPTNFPFGQALTTGINAFFSIPGGGGIGLNQLVGAFTSSTDSPGFNAVVARAITRSSVTIVNQLKGIGGNVMNVINGILALLDTIRSSALIGACNVFASLGDAQLSLPSDWVDSDVTNTTKVSSMDQIDNSLTTAASKNRLQGSLKLAWASNRSNTNLLLPASILGAASLAKNLGQFDPFVGVGQDPLSLTTTTTTVSSDNGRIDAATAATFEQQFDAEYVPFYFHDLRTNEMVGFHAFLSALNDDFTAGYERSEGYGRVEPVKVYKGTERRINMAFYIVATSQNDFDEMWVKINKLVTLVYPQDTQGVSVQDASSATYSFTQPFSQLIGASPMIRIRLGDLLKSNYSQFALARLFGLGNPNFMVNKQQFTQGDSFSGATTHLETAIGLALSNPNNETYYVAPGSYPLFQSSGGGFSVSIGDSGPSNPPVFSPQVFPVPGLFVAVAAQLDSDVPGNMICSIRLNTDPEFQQLYASMTSAAQSQYGDSSDPLQNFIGGSYSIPTSALTPTPQTKQALVAKLSSDSASGFVQALSDFISPQNNAIAKSFADVGGKGLAGFIETMSFDWFDKVTWETTPYRVAPKICKVTIGFSPIHDISPGIDHLGYNRAPVYGVGLMANSYQKAS